MRYLALFIMIAVYGYGLPESFLKGEALYSQKKYNIAAGLLQKSLEKDPLNYLTYFYLGNIKLKQKEFVKADNYYQKAVDLKDKDPAIFYNYAFLKVKQQMYDVAEQLYRRSLQLNSNYAMSYSGLARLYYRVYKWKKSADNFEQLLQVKPDHPDKKNILQWIKYLRGNLDYARKKRKELYPDEFKQDEESTNAAYSIDIEDEGKTKEMESKSEKSIEDIELDLDIVE
ncbi:MAG TPA: tetratricopeptide repeat protein [Spirochaetota bacterium]|nr:tetratricopeptide repeat protein [Spirochaetota bacterium]